MLIYHRKVTPAEVEVQAAQTALGLTLSLVGALGKRTKFQEKEVSQLTLRATFAPHAAARPAVGGAEEAGPMPQRVDEEDDTLLAQVRAG